MRPDLFAPGDSVLLLGEGNFSFSVGLLKLGLGIRITATCFESVLSKYQTENLKCLKSQGVCTMTGIDATKVHEHTLLITKKFDKIVFNFPHVGGKMKIHLNRELLRDFFCSASKILSRPKGQIIVSLCRSQGADYLGKRTWSDSWQVVDMAGYANLQLVECCPFDWSLYPSYSNVGYRSLEKGFHSEDAMVHVFSYAENTLNQHVDSVTNYYLRETDNDILTRPLFCRMIKRDILKDKSSPTCFILKSIEKQASLKFKHRLYVENKIYYQDLEESYVTSALNVWEKSGCDNLLYSFYIVNQCASDFSQKPLITQALLIGSEIRDIFSKSIAELTSISKMCDHIVVIRGDDGLGTSGVEKVFLQGKDECDRIMIAKLQSFCVKGTSQPVLSIYLDTLVSFFFSVNCWRQIWANNMHVAFLSGRPVVAGICPYPVCYVYDISFSITKDFTEEIFFQFVWDIAGEFVVNVKKVSEFCPSSEGMKSLCFRLSYLSYEHSMCKRTVLDFHHNVLAKSLESILNVCIK